MEMRWFITGCPNKFRNRKKRKKSWKFVYILSSVDLPSIWRIWDFHSELVETPGTLLVKLPKNSKSGHLFYFGFSFWKKRRFFAFNATAAASAVVQKRAMHFSCLCRKKLRKCISKAFKCIQFVEREFEHQKRKFDICFLNLRERRKESKKTNERRDAFLPFSLYFCIAFK